LPLPVCDHSISRVRNKNPLLFSLPKTFSAREKTGTHPSQEGLAHHHLFFGLLLKKILRITNGLAQEKSNIGEWQRPDLKKAQ